MKVFGVGFQRTGTTSLAEALRLLGIRTLQFPKQLYYDLDDDVIRQYDGFTDDPITLLYRDLDARHPGSKFIHTVRDETAWLDSMRWLLTTGKAKFGASIEAYGNEFNRELFGRTTFDAESFLETYRTYNRQVSEYFADRPDDYLVIDLTRGEGWEKLCPFLGKPTPDVPLPHLNKAESLGRIYARRALGALRRSWTALRGDRRGN